MFVAQQWKLAAVDCPFPVVGGSNSSSSLPVPAAQQSAAMYSFLTTSTTPYLHEYVLDTQPIPLTAPAVVPLSVTGAFQTASRTCLCTTRQRSATSMSASWPHSTTPGRSLSRSASSMPCQGCSSARLPWCCLSSLQEQLSGCGWCSSSLTATGGTTSTAVAVAVAEVKHQQQQDLLGGVG